MPRQRIRKLPDHVLAALPEHSRAHMGRAARNMVTLAEPNSDLVPAARIAITVGVPLTILVALGRLDVTLFASFAAFSAMYGRYVPTRVRLAHQAIAGGVLVASLLAGSLTSLAVTTWGLPRALTGVLLGALIAGLTAIVAPAFNLRPRGVLFFVFAGPAVVVVGSAVPIWLAMSVALATLAWSLALSASFHFLGEANRHRPAPAPEKLTRSDIAQDMGRFSTAALLSGLIGMALAIPAPYWAQISAVAPLSEARRLRQIERAVHRVIGTGLGVVVAAFLLSFPSEPWQLVVWVVVLQFFAEYFVLRNYSLGLIFITPLALITIHLASGGTEGNLLLPRLVETAIGSFVGILMAVASVGIERLLARRRGAP